MIQDELFRETSLWFGNADKPLFGRLTTPIGEEARAGVLLSPPIGRESRQTRRALRSLAIYLAIDGYVSLRYDHYGTGDSSGSMDDEFDRAWLEGVDQGVTFLRSLGISSVSAVGIRMGATIVGAAASRFELGLSSFVMWDPCESGRSYLRELNALGALRQDVNTNALGVPTKMLEYSLSAEASERLNQFARSEPTLSSVAERTLIIVRDDRAVSRKFRDHWNSEQVEWATNSEQGPMLEAQLPNTVPPTSTIAQIRSFLTAPPSLSTGYSQPIATLDAIVSKDPVTIPVRESLVELGAARMFGVIAEPVSEARGPLLVMVNGVGEDHVGPARLWVELSRRWAGLGLRCIRFDLRELGESPWLPGQPDRPILDKTRAQDVGDAIRAVNSNAPSKSVLIGFCNGAQLALEVALELKNRGVAAINPQLGTGVFLNVDRLDKSDQESTRSFAQRIEKGLQRYPWIDKIFRPISNRVLSSKLGGSLVFGALRLTSPCPPRIRSKLVKNETETLLLLSSEDLSPLRNVPVLGSVLRRRLASSEHFRIEIVPGLDHAFLSVVGRERAIAILDQHVVQTYANDVAQSNSNHTAVDGP
ncbi:MAG: Alpha/beta hydrolase family protein [Acidimicrobiaceae bacterium]|nr:Alpha/beta hydrolase family protein [Acidimicrobiaceae bacterium]